MSDVTFKQVYELVMQLSPEDQQLLSELLAEQLEPDPDEGLTLKPEIAARVKAAQEAKARGEKRKLISHEDVLKELGLDD
jgi:hypothetical protein